MGTAGDISQQLSHCHRPRWGSRLNLIHHTASCILVANLCWFKATVQLCSLFVLPWDPVIHWHREAKCFHLIHLSVSTCQCTYQHICKKVKCKRKCGRRNKSGMSSGKLHKYSIIWGFISEAKVYSRWPILAKRKGCLGDGPF